MKIVVIGGTGLIGSKTVAILHQGGHEVGAASPNSGVNSITGEGLKETMAGAQVVIDLANSPSFEDKAVLEFFETSGRNLLAAETASRRPPLKCGAFRAQLRCALERRTRRWREMDSNFQYASTERWHRVTDLLLPPTVKWRSAGRPPPMWRDRVPRRSGVPRYAGAVNLVLSAGGRWIRTSSTRAR